jgi:hypothetical protein
LAKADTLSENNMIDNRFILVLLRSRHDENINSDCTKFLTLADKIGRLCQDRSPCRRVADTLPNPVSSARHQ